ncbi:MAG TPA: HEAT repeat domain-containing protein [Candidatus Methanoperedens sp.]|nr:HEAT repeat domain-containing protein [Candidatus Methanoperedens sp.]
MAGVRDDGDERRERLAEKAEATSAGLVVQALAKADRGFTLYLPNNPLHEKFFEDFRRRVEEHLGTYGVLVLELTHQSLLFRGEPVYTSTELRENIAFRMYADGIRSLALEEGVEPRELRALVEIVGRSSQEADEDDIATRLWSAELPHVTYVLADLPSAGGEGARAVAAPATAQDGAIRRYAATLAAAPPPPAPPPPVAAQVFTLGEEELGALRALVAAEEERTPLAEMASILAAIIPAEEDAAVLEEFLEIIARLCGDLLLTGRTGEAVALLSVLAAAAAAPGLPPGHAERIDGARGRVLTPAVTDRFTRLLGRDDGADLAQLRPLIAALGRHAIEPFCRVLGDVPGKETRKVLVEALADTGRGLPECFLPFLADARWYLVRNTIYILRRVGGEESGRAILRCAQHRDPRVRREVLLYFEESGDPAGDSVPLTYLADDTPSLRMAAARTLARRGSRAGTERLLAAIAAPAFGERARDEREIFWEALAALAPAQALPRLRELLLKRRLFGQTKELDDTACACAGLKRIGTPEAAALLREGLAAKRGEPRDLVERTLRALARGKSAAAPAAGDGFAEVDRG